MFEVTVTGTDMVKKTVGKHPTAGVIYVPKDWVGKKVIVVLEETE